METWAIVTLVLGSSAVSALLTFLITKMQVSHSDKRLERELENTKETDYRLRRREIKGEPLLKMRGELALMATKGQKLATTAMLLHTNIGTGLNEEQIKGLLDTASNERNTYMHSGVFEQVLFTVDDKEIAEKVEQIRLEYKMLHYRNVNWQRLPPEQLPQTLILPKEIRDKIREVQSLINKRLEEL